MIQGEKHVHTPVSIREQRDSGSDDVRQVSNDTNSEGGDDSAWPVIWCHRNHPCNRHTDSFDYVSNNLSIN